MIDVLTNGEQQILQTSALAEVVAAVAETTMATATVTVAVTIRPTPQTQIELHKVSWQDYKHMSVCFQASLKS